MIVIPAIDIRAGRVVRLRQGDYNRETVYAGLPSEAAAKWEAAGAGMIHVVDLDGALRGKSVNLSVVTDIAKRVKAKIELGGGLRDEASISAALKAGAYRVVIGTGALNKDFLASCVKKFGDRIVVGIDAKDGMVRTKGWTEGSDINALDLAREIERLGVKTVIYTDIATDGMLKGPNIKALSILLDSVKMDVIASGGVSSIDDIMKLKAVGKDNLAGVIIGKALYEDTIDLKEAIKVCSQKG